MKKLSIAVCLSLVLYGCARAQAEDKLAGTWKLNVAMSQFSPGPPPQSQTTRLEAVEGGLREIVDRVNPDGSSTHWDLTARYDGKGYPVEGDADRDAVSLRRIDEDTVEIISKKAGTVTTTMRIVVAEDGKSRSNTVSGTNSRGDAVNHVLFFDRE